MTRTLFLLLFCIQTSQASCPALRHDLVSRVAHTYDGDTFTLEDNTRVRFIGINTPELGRNGKPDQAYAKQATNTLIQLLAKSSNKVILQYGEKAKDHYKRRLAHVFLADGTNVSEQLLLKGLAYRIAVPPNLWAQDCYLKAENKARESKIGLWSRDITQSTQLPLNSKGFQYVEGEIYRIGHSRKSIWLNLNGNLSVRIALKDLHYFKDINIEQLQNKQIRVRGWVHNYKKENILRLRHSSMLEIVK